MRRHSRPIATPVGAMPRLSLTTGMPGSSRVAVVTSTNSGVRSPDGDTLTSTTL